MTIFKPRSILQLVVLSFFAVVTPLVVGLIVIAQQLEALSQESRDTVAAGAEAMRASRALIEQTSSLERNARQYSVLGDAELLELYTERRQALRETVEELNQLEVSQTIDTEVAKLLANETRAFEHLSRLSESGQTDVQAQFPPLMEFAHRISRGISDWIDGQILALKEQADRTLVALRVLAICLVAMAIIMAVVFTLLITRPLRQIDRAIHGLGEGGFDAPIQIEGPQDLQELGERLDWLRNRLSELEQQRTRFLQHVSHELKTPLTAIHEGVALLDEKVAGPLTSQQAELTHILNDNCHRLQSLIENLLRFRASELGNMQALPRPLRFDMVVEQVLRDQSPALQAGDIRIVQNLARLNVMGDEEQLRVAIDNLLVNAVRYSPPGGSIEISLYGQGDWAIFEIADEGPGIPAEEGDRIFEAFYQGKPPERSYIQGSGLGLAIAAEYLEMNKGRVTLLDSTIGAHFRVYIPSVKETHR